jgi:LacI family transcriptional regulator
MNNITMKDVGKLAGVSATTVSHVVNKSRFVSDNVKKRVLKAMEELNYQPNAIAKSLRQKSTLTIGLIISDISNPFFTGMVRGVEDTAAKFGYNLILCNTDENPDKERDYLHILRQKQIDGIIMAPTSGNSYYIGDLVKKGFPIVFIDRYLKEVDAPSVLVNNEEGAYQAIKHLIYLGHKEIGAIIGLDNITSTSERLNGYRRAVEEFGLTVKNSLIKQGNSKVAGGYQATLELLDIPSPPTAIFAANNLMTIGVMNALRSKSIRCPQDVAVIGFDDFEWASTFRPYLTTVAQPVYELGSKAAEVLIKRIRKEKSGNILLGCNLIVRESCGSPI